jgi:ABC-2 type transport system ATP-binding protein
MIESFELTKVFDDFTAVDKVSIKVESGEVFALLGPNGAGKTTTVRMLMSILKPTSGWARVNGLDVVQQASRVRSSVGLLTEQHGLYLRMKAHEYLDFFGEVYHLDKSLRRERARELMTRFGLGDDMNRRLSEFSKGMRQKLSLVRAMLHDPPVLLLDEPTSAMDPQSAKLVRDAILELRQGDRTIIITTHNLNEAQILADRIAIIRKGRIIANGTFDELVTHFFGAPLMEVKVRGTLNGAARDLAEIVDVQETGENWLRYPATEPEQVNPAVIKRLVGGGAEVVTVSEVSRSLEAVYLKIVEEDEAHERVS